MEWGVHAERRISFDTTCFINLSVWQLFDLGEIPVFEFFRYRRAMHLPSNISLITRTNNAVGTHVLRHKIQYHNYIFVQG